MRNRCMHSSAESDETSEKEALLKLKAPRDSGGRLHRMCDLDPTWELANCVVSGLLYLCMEHEARSRNVRI